MGTLIGFEFRKFLNQKKNVGIMLVFVAFIGIFIAVNLKNEKNEAQQKMNQIMYELGNVTQELEIYRTNDMQNSERNYVQRKYDVLNELSVAANKGDWKEQLRLQIILDKMKLQNENLNEYNFNKLQTDVEVNEILYEKNIKPIFSASSMQSYNFIRLILGGMLPVLIILMILLLTSDIVSTEKETGTYKILMSQPISRTKILFSKIIAQTLICLLFLFLLFAVFFVLLGIAFGYGSPEYPTLFYTGEYICISSYITIMIPLFALSVIAINSYSALCSVLFKSGISSISFSMIIFLALYILSSKMNFVRKIAAYNPLMYFFTDNVLNGSFNYLDIVYWKSFIIFPLMITLFTFTSAVVFNKKNYGF